LAQKKHQITQTYLIDSRGHKQKRLVIEVDYNTKGLPVRVLNRVYENGKRREQSIAETSYAPNGEKTEEVITWQVEGYTKKQKYTYSYREGVVEEMYNSCKHINYYDAKHNLIKSENICSNQLASVATYRYDALGRKIRMEFYSLPDSARYQLVNTSYNDSLKTKIVETEEKLDASIKSSTQIEYLNDQNQPLRLEDQATKEYSLFFYNAQGDFIRRQMYDSDNKLEAINQTKTKYWK
jgi:hypothetical protein